MSLPNLLVTIGLLLVGWASLFPARCSLGAVGYHLMAFPVGLGALPIGVAVASVLGVAYGPGMAVGAGAFYTALVFGGAWVLTRAASEGSRVVWWSWLAWGGVFTAVALVATASGFTYGAYDSIFHYQSWAVWLHDQGSLTPQIVGAYDLFLPSLHAVVMAAGGDWAFTPYTLMSLNLIAVLGWAMWRTLPGLGTAGRAATVIGFVGLLVTIPTYRYHSFYAHSHMASALFLLCAIVALREAYLGRGASDPIAGRAWMIVAGICGAVFALVRTDGLAYAAVVLALIAILEVLNSTGRERLIAGYSSFFGTLAIVYGAAFSKLGLWEGSKMSGKRAALVLVALALLAAATVLLVPLVKRLMNDRRMLIGSIVGANWVLVLGAWSLRKMAFTTSVTNMLGNLTRTGGWGFVWFFVVGLFVISIALRRAYAEDEWMELLAYAVAQLFFIAMVVHGLTHGGRLDAADSFNRLSFHALPLIFWYAALFTARLSEAIRKVPR